MSPRALGVLVVLAGALVLASPARAFDPAQTFAPGTFVLSGEAGYGEQHNVEAQEHQTGLDFANGGVRFGWLPFGPVGPGILYGAFEAGLEPFYQRYVEPVDASFGGLAAVFRYHFLSLGRLVPYAEVSGAAGGTDLKVREINSDFTFLLFGGVGSSFFLTDRTALYAGYRLQHVSNGNTKSPNRGFESHTGVIGVSVYFP